MLTPEGKVIIALPFVPMRCGEACSAVRAIVSGTSPARFAFRAFVAVSLLLAQTAVSLAAPAHAAPFVLRKPDGTPFVARQFGDEWMNGTETVDGYTIIKDARSGV